MPTTSSRAHDTLEQSPSAHRRSSLRELDSHEPIERSMTPLPAVQQVMGNRALQRMLQRHVQRTCSGCEEALSPVAAAPPVLTTSLPTRLKTGVEALSGISMDSVRVHYNSPEPARVQALAYTQGTDIHVAPGQEKHLAHEAWHVVQQQQGDVRPTMQLAGTAINDDSSLEREADSMGARADRMGQQETLAKPEVPLLTAKLSPCQRVVQRRYDTLEEFEFYATALSDVYGNLDQDDVENAFRAYQHAQQTGLRLAIMGRLVKQSSEAEPGIDDPLRDNFLRMNEADRGGSVLYSGRWSMLMNDAWVLGGLHSGTPFYLASPRTSQNLTGTNPDFPMTVTARELIAITQFGYEIVSGHSSLGEVAQLVDENAASRVTLEEYALAVQNAVAGRSLKSKMRQQLMAPAKPVYKR